MERLEPKFYLNKYLINKNKISSSEFKLHKLSEVCNLISDGTHFTPKYQEDGVKFLSVKDVRPFNISYDNSKFISVSEAILLDKRCKPQKNDILLTKIGATFGYAAVVDSIERFQIFVSLALLRPNKELISSDFLCLCLNSNWFYLLFERVIKGAGVPDLHLEDIRKIKIPVPPLQIQSEIVEIFNTAYAEKCKKETKAKELLASIDAYLLEQLGIVLPDKIEEKNVFYVPFSKVQGSRFDPFYHKDEFEINNDAVLKGKYKVETIKEVCKNLIKGRLPKDSEKDGSCKVVQINSVKMDGSIDLEDLLTAKPIFTQNQLLQENDVLIVITGATIGKISFWQYEGEYYLGGDIVKFQCNEGINPYYIYSYLRIQIIQTEIKRNITGATNGHLSPSDINNFPIPIPPLEIQTEIANYIRNIRERAKTLENEAKEVIEKAKAEVEKIILGE